MTIHEFPRQPKKLVIKTHHQDGSYTEHDASLGDVWSLLTDRIDLEVCRLERQINKRTWPRKISEIFVLASFLGNFWFCWHFYAKSVLGWNI